MMAEEMGDDRRFLANIERQRNISILNLRRIAETATALESRSEGVTGKLFAATLMPNEQVQAVSE